MTPTEAENFLLNVGCATRIERSKNDVTVRGGLADLGGISVFFHDGIPTRITVKKLDGSHVVVFQSLLSALKYLVK